MLLILKVLPSNSTKTLINHSPVYFHTPVCLTLDYDQQNDYRNLTYRETVKRRHEEARQQMSYQEQ